MGVTQKDIDTGTRSSTRHCPIAKAARRAGLRVFEVEGREIVLRSGYYYKLPALARHFINRFDAGLSVKPFSFKLGRLRKWNNWT